MPTRATLLGLPRFRTAYVVRGLLVWAAIRLALAVLHAMGVPVPLDLPLSVEVGVVILVPLAVVLDARRRGEDLFLANLGIPGHQAGVLAALGAALMECLVP